jgi:hypothetical protein
MKNILTTILVLSTLVCYSADPLDYVRTSEATREKILSLRNAGREATLVPGTYLSSIAEPSLLQQSRDKDAKKYGRQFRVTFIPSLEVPICVRIKYFNDGFVEVIGYYDKTFVSKKVREGAIADIEKSFKDFFTKEKAMVKSDARSNEDMDGIRIFYEYLDGNAYQLVEKYYTDIDSIDNTILFKTLIILGPTERNES